MLLHDNLQRASSEREREGQHNAAESAWRGRTAPQHHRKNAIAQHSNAHAYSTPTVHTSSVPKLRSTQSRQNENGQGFLVFESR